MCSLPWKNLVVETCNLEKNKRKIDNCHICNIHSVSAIILQTQGNVRHGSCGRKYEYKPPSTVVTCCFLGFLYVCMYVHCTCVNAHLPNVSFSHQEEKEYIRELGKTLFRVLLIMLASQKKNKEETTRKPQSCCIKKIKKSGKESSSSSSLFLQCLCCYYYYTSTEHCRHNILLTDNYIF